METFGSATSGPGLAGALVPPGVAAVVAARLVAVVAVAGAAGVGGGAGGSGGGAGAWGGWLVAGFVGDVGAGGGGIVGGAVGSAACANKPTHDTRRTAKEWIVFTVIQFSFVSRRARRFSRAMQREPLSESSRQSCRDATTRG